MNDPFSDLPLNSDNEFDAFQCSQLARTIATLFEKRTAPPSNIAVYGPWGSGKSSLLYLLQKYLIEALGQDAPLWIEIDAWAYQTEDTLIYAILSELYKKAKEPVKESLLRIALGTTLSLADLALKHATLGNLDVEAIAKNLESAEGPKPFESKHLKLRDEFARIISKLKKSKKPGLGRHVLIAIDNLDRCKPDAAIKVLETIFLVGNTTDSTFLIAVDQHVLISFLNRQYEGTNFSGARYLEKIFPLAYRIPDPWVCWNYEQACNSIPETGESADEDMPPDQVLLYLEKLLPKSWDDRDNFDDGDDDSIFATVWHYLSQIRILRNPRRIKRIVRLISGYKPEHQEDAEKVLFLVIFADIWPDAFEFFLCTNNKAWEIWVDYMAKAGTKSIQTELPRDGVRSADQELREFFYQIRDFYESDDYPARDRGLLMNHLYYLREIGI